MRALLTFAFCSGLLLASGAARAEGMALDSGNVVEILNKTCNTCPDPGIEVRDASGKVLKTFAARERELILDSAVTPDERYLITSTTRGEGIVRVYSMATGQVVKQMRGSPVRGGWAGGLSVSPDGRYLAVTTGPGSTPDTPGATDQGEVKTGLTRVYDLSQLPAALPVVEEYRDFANWGSVVTLGDRWVVMGIRGLDMDKPMDSRRQEFWVVDRQRPASRMPLVVTSGFGARFAFLPSGQLVVYGREPIPEVPMKNGRQYEVHVLLYAAVLDLTNRTWSSVPFSDLGSSFDNQCLVLEGKLVRLQSQGPCTSQTTPQALTPGGRWDQSVLHLSQLARNNPAIRRKP